MEIVKKYAQLLVHYCLELQENERLYIRSTLLAEPLVREVYREAIKCGAHVETDFSFCGESRIFLNEAGDQQLQYVPVLYEEAIKNFEAFLSIRAPYNLREEQHVKPENRMKRTRAFKEINKAYFQRTANRDLKRCLCQFPTQASAQEAGMSLEEYEEFVYNACHLFNDKPDEAWLKIRQNQTKIVELLNSKELIRYENENTDISFSVKDRVWINSDGQTNMPSGEVYTAPVEDSVNGFIHFTYPSIYLGREIEGISLWVERGKVVQWEADKGQDALNEIMSIDGARYFGEAAIGTNYNILIPTKNILFDEKMGGTIHMALGQSYFQAGGKNNSSIHHDMIADMKNGGIIYADGEKIYENGSFIV